MLLVFILCLFRILVFRICARQKSHIKSEQPIRMRYRRQSRRMDCHILLVTIFGFALQVCVHVQKRLRYEIQHFIYPESRYTNRMMWCSLGHMYGKTYHDRFFRNEIKRFFPRWYFFGGFFFFRSLCECTHARARAHNHNKNLVKSKQYVRHTYALHCVHMDVTNMRWKKRRSVLVLFTWRRRSFFSLSLLLLFRVIFLAKFLSAKINEIRRFLQLNKLDW